MIIMSYDHEYDRNDEHLEYDDIDDLEYDDIDDHEYGDIDDHESP